MVNTAVAQSDWRVSVPASLDAGLNFARVERDPNSDWLQRPAYALNFASGIALRYKERLHLNAMLGGTLDGYSFYSSYATYDITHVFLQTKVNVNYLFPFRNDRTKAIVVGSELGRSFIGPDFKLRSESNFFVRTDAFGPATNFISPELGFARTWAYGQMSFLLAYHYQFREDYAVKVTITESNDAQTVARVWGDYLALRLRANFDIQGHKAPIQELTPAPTFSGNMLGRGTRVRREISSSRQVVYLKFWDNAEIDGDTISVSLNGRFILTEHGLDHRKKRVKVVLEPGENVIVVHAHNEGRIPPNTAAFSIRTGWFKKEQLVFSTNMKRNESIVVRY